MLTVIQRICIFAFVISPVLRFGNALASPSTRTASSAPTAVEAQINLTPTTAPVAAQRPSTTTLASSNAPATTIDAVLADSTMQENGAEEIDGNGEGDGDGDGDAIVTTMLPEILQQTTKFDEAISATTTSTFVLDQGEATTSNVGNEVKTEIENSERDVSLHGMQSLLPVTENVHNVHQHSGELDSTAIPNILKNVEKSETLQEAPAVEITTPTTSSTTPAAAVDATDTSHNHIRVEGKLKTGLYRIKLAEIVTDEFGHLPRETNVAEKTSDVHDHTKEEDHESSKRDFASAGGVNIADLYPMKKEDFNPIIRDSNTESLEGRTLFKKPLNEAEYRQNLLPNEVEFEELETQTQTQTLSDTLKKSRPRQLQTLEMTLRSRDGSDAITDFTGKLLAERDGIITEIEQKFRLNEFSATEASKTTSPSKITTFTAAHAIDSVTTTSNTPTETTKPASFINRQISKKSSNINSKGNGNGNSNGNGMGHVFIDRRVKKSYSFPMHRVASDVMSEPYIDFANTKFTGNSGIANGSPAVNAKTFTADSATNSGNSPSSGVVLAGAAHPEFSTTKFYNSKELYNEMIMHNRLKQLQNKSATTTTHAVAVFERPQANGFTATTTVVPGAASRFATLKNTKTSPVVSKVPLSSTSSASSTSTSSTSLSNSSAEIVQNRANIIAPAVGSEAVATSSSSSSTATPTTTKTSTIQPSAAEVGLEIASVTSRKTKKFQNGLKRAKLLLKVVLPPTPSPSTANTSATIAMTPITTSSMSSLIAQSTPNLSTARTSTLSSSITASTNADALHSISMTAIAAATTKTTPQQNTVTNPTKATSRPIARPRILTSLQEKINSLECEIQNVPQDSHLWRGNETHELFLPIITPAHCATFEQQRQAEEHGHGEGQGQGQEHQNQHQHQRDCSTTPVSVSWDGESEIQSGDILIVEINDASLLKDKSSSYSAHFTQVYQVTRSGHEHCDVTEGILLDITPLVVDGRKLVTLYDKDLTEGVNLLIVVSELWGSQCVRLKVTAKTDNCGENADCSGKGVCYSNAAMEEYECQCCGGFAGPHCEEIDACTPSPCTNNGICVDLSQGHDGNSYQCLCPYGYTGKNCQYESDPCNPAECMNGGSCVGNSTHFRCDCSPGYAGPLCQHSLNECESSPCVHGICVDQEDGFRCFCQPGFAGELCNFEYNECESNPCQNGGECIDHIGSFECRCTKGYTGNRCQTKVDFCANKPCPEGHSCIDHGNDFSCECPGGRNGPDCNQMARTQCNVNPCTHGGTCWSSGDSFYCACRPGYTGTMCEDEFVVETVVSSSEFIVDDVNAQNLNDKTFGSSVLKSPIELHNAYFAAGVLAAAFFIVAVVVTICHCKVNQTYRKFSTRTTSFIPIIGFGRRPKPQSKLNKHWLSGKGLGSGNSLRSTASAASSRGSHLSSSSSNGTALHHSQQQQQQHQHQQQTNVGQLHERPFQRHLAMNLENDMYYTVDFSENSQHSPLIQ